jgi:hypothetical protein
VTLERSSIEVEQRLSGRGDRRVPSKKQIPAPELRQRNRRRGGQAVQCVARSSQTSDCSLALRGASGEPDSGLEDSPLGQ